MARRAVPLLLGLAALLTACGGGATGAGTTGGSATAQHAAGQGAAQQRTVWLCFPGRTPDPCAGSLATTVVRADGSRQVVHPSVPARPPVDCFYVYPTVSQEATGNADLAIQLPELLVAQAQAEQFSRVCRVYAPMYRQITTRGLATPSLHARPLLAYTSLLDAWRDYLAHDNHGRGVVLIGHSQGAYVLKQLVRTQIDRSPATRRLLVSAILLGGQVLAGDTHGAAGDFAHVPPCSSPAETGCVIAYSSFGTTPPPNARFGRDADPRTHVLCVNPARPGSRAAVPVTSFFPAGTATLLGGSTAAGSAPATAWVAYPDRYTVRCERAGTASWLQVTPVNVPGDRRPTVRPLFGPGWGLHASDVNVALDDLIRVVAAESRSFARKR